MFGMEPLGNVYFLITIQLTDELFYCWLIITEVN
jgi:hypothetical protein